MDFSQFCLTALQVLGMMALAFYFGHVFTVIGFMHMVNKMKNDGQLEVKEND